MLSFIRSKILQIGYAVVIVGCLALLLEFTSNADPEISSLKTYQGTLDSVPRNPIEVRGIKIKTYSVRIKTADGGIVNLRPDVGLVTPEKLAPFLGKPAVARVSKTDHIWTLDLNGSPVITYDQVKKISASRSNSLLPYWALGAGLLFLLVGYLIPRSKGT